MNSNVAGQRVDGGLGILRAAALMVLPVGAVASVGFMAYAGRRNPSRILLALFTLWVLSPFVAMVLAYMVSKGWPVLARRILYIVMLVLTLTSVAIYGYVALGPPRPKTASVFVMIPPVSWVLMAVVGKMAAMAR